MHLYLVTRWGNPDRRHRSEGDDTNFLIRATTVEEAGELADSVLIDIPLSHSGEPSIEGFAQYIRRIGEDAAPSDAEPEILHGPWIEFAMADGEYEAWERGDADGEWLKVEFE